VNESTLSVIIPAHNAAATLEALVEGCLSLLPRFFADIEIVIVEDDSGDDTPRLADRLAAEHDPVVVLHQWRRSGYGPALAHGIGAARGDYIAALDADAPRGAELLARLVPALDGAAVVAGVPLDQPQGDWPEGAENGPLLARADALRALPLSSAGRLILPEIVYRARRKGMAVALVALRDLTAQPASLRGRIELLRQRSRVGRGERGPRQGQPWQVKALVGGALAALVGGAWVALRRR
jgi:glycosyltransferase involved in cell wall biosynthesis